MAVVDVRNLQGKTVGQVELADAVFAAQVNPHLLHEAVRWYLAGERAGTHKTKGRGEVSGSGRKLWRQKGTGRARVGSIRSSIWRKGGTVFGPQPRSYEYRLPKKVEQGALRSALAQKVKDGALVVVDELATETIKTKAAAEMLARLGVSGKAILLDVVPDQKLAKSVRNIADVAFIASSRVTARDIIGASRIVVTRGALEKLQAALS